MGRLNEYLEVVSYRAWSILPIGSVNLDDGSNQYINVLKDSKTVVLLQNNSGKYKAIFGAQGNYSSPGKKEDLKHDQTGSNMGTWEVIFVKDVSKETLESIAKITGKKKIVGAVFK